MKMHAITTNAWRVPVLIPFLGGGLKSICIHVLSFRQK